MKKLFLLSSIVFVLLSVIATAQDIKVLNFYDGDTYFDGHVASKMAYDHYRNKVYCVTVDTKNANQNRYFLRMLEDGAWQQINTVEQGYPYGDTLFIKGIDIDKHSRVWITTSEGFLKYENEKWEKIETEDIEGLKVKSYVAVIPDSLGNAFLYINYGYLFYSGGPVTQIMRMNLYKYMPEGNTLIYSCDSANYVDNPVRLGGISPRAYCADDKGNIWLASDQNTNGEDDFPKIKGMMRYSDTEGKFEFFEMKNLSKNMQRIMPQQLIYDKDHLWLVNGWSYAGGISRMSLQTQEWELFDSFDGMKDLSSAFHRLQTMVQDGDSILWGGTFGWGLLKFDLKAKKVERISFADVLNRDDLRYKLNEVYNSFKDKDGNNWFVTRAGIIKTEGKKTTSADNVEEPRFGVFPNPASDRISITGLDINLSGKVAIYSQLGVKALETSAVEGMIDVSSLPAGVYLLRAGGGAAKFVKI